MLMRKRGAGQVAVILLAAVIAVPACRSAEGEGKIRPSALAGTWYPGEKSKLRKTVENFCASAKDAKLDGRLFALIAPHAGYRWSGNVASHAYRQVKRGVHNCVILLGPSHSSGFRGFSIMDVDAYRTPLGDVPLDREICKELRGHRLHVKDDSLHWREHSLEIHLPFLQCTVGSFNFVPIIVGRLVAGDCDAIGAAIRPHLTPETLVVVSSDFTHYGPRFYYVPFRRNLAKNIRDLDMGAVDLIVKKDYGGYTAYMEKTRATICGRNPIAILLRLLPPQAKGKLLKYDTSGRMTRDFSNSVSYVSVAFTVGKQAKAGEGMGRLTQSEQGILLEIARATLDAYVKSHVVPGGLDKRHKLTPRLKAKSGCFVTLKKNGRLRGCIGRIGYPEIADRLPLLYACIKMMTVQSAAADRRFKPVRHDELDQIQIEISVLSIAKEVSGPDKFQVGEHGIIIRKGRSSAVFLPQVATAQGWNREQTLGYLCRKAGLPANAWKEPAMKFFTFTAQVFGESLLQKH